MEARIKYARGELGREDYLRIARDLGHDIRDDRGATPPAATPEPPEPPAAE